MNIFNGQIYVCEIGEPCYSGFTSVRNTTNITQSDHNLKKNKYMSKTLASRLFGLAANGCSPKNNRYSICLWLVFHDHKQSVYGGQLPLQIISPYMRYKA